MPWLKQLHNLISELLFPKSYLKGAIIIEECSPCRQRNPSSSAQCILFQLSKACGHDEKKRVIALMCLSDITSLYFFKDTIIFMSALSNPIDLYAS